MTISNLSKTFKGGHLLEKNESVTLVVMCDMLFITGFLREFPKLKVLKVLLYALVESE